MERVASYPGSLWTLVVGALAMMLAGRTGPAPLAGRTPPPG